MKASTLPVAKLRQRTWLDDVELEKSRLLDQADPPALEVRRWNHFATAFRQQLGYPHSLSLQVPVSLDVEWIAAVGAKDLGVTSVMAATSVQNRPVQVHDDYRRQVRSRRLTSALISAPAQ